MNEVILWAIINSLPVEGLEERSIALHKHLKQESPERLVMYYKSASETFRSLFNKKTINYYLMVYEGESNRSGFISFCSNVILMGESSFSLFQHDPDKFFRKFGKGDFNEDYNDVAETASHLVEEALDTEEIEKLANEFLGEEFRNQKLIWDEIRDRGILFSLDRDYAEHEFPETWEKLNSE